MSAGPSGALFRDLAQDFIRAYLPEAEYRRFVAVRERCREAVEHGRVGDWDAARAQFAAAEEKAAAGEMGEAARSEEHTSEIQSLMRISYAVFCLKKKKMQEYNK